jgi:hypothetical protein
MNWISEFFGEGLDARYIAAICNSALLKRIMDIINFQPFKISALLVSVLLK